MDSRFANHAWLAKHGLELDKYSGKWVAVADEQLVGVAESLKELLALPGVKRYKNPLVTMIPLPEEVISSLGIG